MTKPLIACMHCGSEKAKRSFADLADRYDFLPPEQSDVILEKGLVFKEVSVTRHSGQSAHMQITIDGGERLATFVGDGLIVSTAVASTAYNLSAHRSCGTHLDGGVE